MVSSESDEESDLGGSGWFPSSVVSMDGREWMDQRFMDCFFYGIANTVPSLIKCGLTEEEVVCANPACKGLRAVSEQVCVTSKVEGGVGANGNPKSLRYMALTPEASMAAAMAAGPAGWRRSPRKVKISLVCEGCFTRMMSAAGVQISAGGDCKAAPDAHTLRCLPWSNCGVNCEAGKYVADRCEQAHEARGIFHRAIREQEAMESMDDDALDSDEEARREL